MAGLKEFDYHQRAATDDYRKNWERIYMQYTWDKENQLWRDNQRVGFLQRQGNGETATSWQGFVDVPTEAPIGEGYVGTFKSGCTARAAVLERVQQLREGK